MRKTRATLLCNRSTGERECSPQKIYLLIIAKKVVFIYINHGTFGLTYKEMVDDLIYKINRFPIFFKPANYKHKNHISRNIHFMGKIHKLTQNLI